MIYPEPVGKHVLYQPAFDAVTEILSRYRARLIGDGWKLGPRLPKNERFSIYCEAVRFHGGWITPQELADYIDVSKHYAQNSLAEYVREGKMQKRFRPDGTREYGAI